MRAREFLFEEPLEEGGKSSAVRYNSELACLAVFAGATTLDSIPDSALANPAKVKKEIQKVMQFYDESIFNRWVRISQSYKSKIQSHYGSLPAKFNWVAGSNAGGVADVEFVDFPISGISIKDTGGITLANLTPKSLGLETQQGVDVIQLHANDEFVNFKEAVFRKVLALAKGSPGTPVNDKYTITYDAENNKFLIDAKKQYEMTEEQIMSGVDKNALWQRPFGDWFQANFQSEKELLKPVVVKVSKAFVDTMSDALKDSTALKKVLQFEDKPYYYASPKSLYYVPAAADADDIELKGIHFANPDGTSLLFKATMGRVDSGDAAEINIYIRYANGLFAVNPTARVQTLKNPQFIAWDKL